MTDEVIDRLLATLDVRLHGFSICEVGEGTRMLVGPTAAVIAHYVLVGSGTLQVGDGPHAPFGPGSILIVPAHKAQRIVSGERAVRDVLADDTCVILPDGLTRFAGGAGAKGDVRMACASLSATYSGAFGLFDGLTSPLVENLEFVPAARAPLDLALAEQAAPKIGSHAITESLMKQALVLLVRSHIERGDRTSPFFPVRADHRLTRAVALVVNNPTINLNVAALAKAAGMSRSTFAKAFTEAFEQTPMDFVQKTRLKQGAQLLIATDMPVKSVAAAVGFASRSNFSHAFRCVYGVDPTGYREQALKTAAASGAL